MSILKKSLGFSLLIILFAGSSAVFAQNDEFDSNDGYQPPSANIGTVPGGPSSPNIGTTPGGPSSPTTGTVPGGPSSPNMGTVPGGPSSPNMGTGNFSSFYIQNPLNSRFNSIGGIIDGFLEIFTYLAVLFAVLMLIWLGFQMVLARGNATKLKELKTALLWVVIGVAIVIGARIIVKVVVNTLEATNIVSSGVIQNANNALRRPN